MVIERKHLTHGSTRHAAGLVGQLRGSSKLTRLMRKSAETYRTLEESTGYATGWRGVGSIRVASSPDRWEALRTAGALARQSYGTWAEFSATYVLGRCMHFGEERFSSWYRGARDSHRLLTLRPNSPWTTIPLR